MNLSSSSCPSSKSPTPSSSTQAPIGSPDAAMPPFTPGQCLLCPASSPSFPDSVAHMQKSHGLFVPYQQHLVVDLESLFRYLHLVIFGYRECIQCGTERATVQAVQQHMTGKGHCKFDVAEEDSEFAEFYDFSEPEDEDDEDDHEGDTGSDDEQVSKEETTASSRSRKPQLADEDSIRLPSGKIISRQSSAAAHAGSSFTRLRRRTRAAASQLGYTTVPDESNDEKTSGKGDFGLEVPDTQAVSKREKRERATMAHQLANMSASDRNSLIHLPTSEQRAILATQHRQTEKVQKEEKRRQTKIDRKGNKNLYAYWHTETPVYQCG